MKATTIPEALHLCPGCGDLASGELYCEASRRAAEFYDTRLRDLASRGAPRTAPREDARDAKRDGSLGCGVAYALLLEAWAATTIFGIYFIFHRWM